MSVKGIIMFLVMNNTRLEGKILIILDVENGFLPTYLPQCPHYITFPSVLKETYIYVISPEFVQDYKA